MDPYLTYKILLMTKKKTQQSYYVKQPTRFKASLGLQKKNR